MIGQLGKHRTLITVTIVALILGVAFGRYASPEKVSIRIQEVEVEKVVIVEKKVLIKEEVKKTSKKTNTVTKKISKPDGTVIEEKTESEEDVTFADTKQKEESDMSATKDKTKITDKSKETKYNTNKLQVSALMGMYKPEGASGTLFESSKAMYGLHAAYSFFGPISVGAFGTSTKELGVSLGISF